MFPQDFSIEEMIQKRIRIEELLFDLKSDHFSEIKTLVHILKKNIVQQILQKSWSINIFNYKIYGDLFAILNFNDIIIPRNIRFSHYLYVRSLITEKNFKNGCPPDKEELMDISDYENPIKSETLEWFIYTDDVKGFVNFITVNNIDINQKVKIQINNELFDFISQFVCYCGSMNILKYCVINEIKIDEISSKSAIAGGNVECIEFLFQKGFSFNKTLGVAVLYHRNKIAMWLCENYKDKYIRLTDSIICHNTEMLIYLINIAHWDINQQEILQRTCLHWTVENNDIVLTKYLLEKGIRKDIHDLYHLLPIDYCESDEIKILLK